MKCSICQEEVPFQTGHYSELDCIKYFKSLLAELRPLLEEKEQEIERLTNQLEEYSNQEQLISTLKKDLSVAREKFYELKHANQNGNSPEIPN